ncbi:MAG TPA: biopolymer transporter ExbD, partial [Gallionella sp.]|nr:biopolymer transporter ExbD [Gallionella sp.]
QALSYAGTEALAASLKNAAGDQADPTIVINADAKAPHQSVINVMEAARLAGYGHITFTTQNQTK